jgi:hypothetical protein
MREHRGLQGHERFQELSALANCACLSSVEWGELQEHLLACAMCREVHRQYELLSREGIPFLAGVHGAAQRQANWDDAAVRRSLFARLSAARHRADSHSSAEGTRWAFVRRPSVMGTWARGLAAACLAIIVAAVAYHLGAGQRSIPLLLSPPGPQSVQASQGEKPADNAIQNQTARISQLEKEEAARKQELAALRTRLRMFESSNSELLAARNQAEDQVHAVSLERDSLTAQLRESEQAYEGVRAELSALRAERDAVQLRTASLQSKVDELSAVNQEQERQLKDDEQYLSSDRDIRELMGARQLYIADVFDVDSGSRKRRPFGRVFYTQNKSLIFYAFDLDRQAGFRNASTFQVWGQKEMAQGEKAHPMNLGILYMDSESNRRWVLRFDDPKQLAEIDAVFVTIEPRGGSPKPTSKPFLYALLRKEANHP